VRRTPNAVRVATLVASMRAWVLAVAPASVLVLAAGAAQAVSVERASPQGSVAQVRQVAVTFTAPVVPFGDLRQPDPFRVQCTGPAPAGSGRWATDRQWLYDFRAPLPPGVSCQVQALADWKPALAAAGALTGNARFAFETGGPAVLGMQPYGGAEIEEDQHFLLQLNGAAQDASVSANAWCEVEGIGERLPLKLVVGAARDELLKARGIDPKQRDAKRAAADAERAARALVATCARPLPADTPVRVVWGRGIAAAANLRAVTTVEQRFGFRVRKPFTAEFSCERERANAPCLPIRPLLLRFSAPVARALAEQVLLRPATGAPLKPVFDKDDKEAEVSEITLALRAGENAAFRIELPAGLKDVSGRAITNASAFPLKVATGDAPPIAKFAAAPFGIVERFAEPGQPALLPLTLRYVQGDLRPPVAGAKPAGQVRIRHPLTDAEIIAWSAQVQRYHERSMTAQQAGLPASKWFTFEEDTDARGKPIRRKVQAVVGTREVSLLAKDAQAHRLDLPALQGGDPRPFEVIGIPISEPGYHVVEVESAKLGAALLDKPAPMYVRTAVLVTNLGVHFKHGRENSLVWVTTLDRGRPVEGADVAVSDCRGQPLWSGRTDAQGLARIPQVLDREQRRCGEGGGGEGEDGEDPGFFVSARKADAGASGVTDMAFVFSGWQKGIEPWRFNLPTDQSAQSTLRAHTVFDRTLLRAGETVSMKHFMRSETSAGLAQLPAAQLPTRAKLTHQGTGQSSTVPLVWSGARSATSSWNIPPAAKLGVYDVTLERDAPPPKRGERTERSSWPAGDFRVEEFRLPLVDARLAGPKAVPVAPRELALALQLNYFSGGGVALAPVKASALLSARGVSFPGFEEFSFTPPRDAAQPDPESSEDTDAAADATRRLVADKLALTTDAQGAATVTLKDLPPIKRASSLQAEVTFNDPNGEVQTVSTNLALWPSAVVLGVKAASWASSRGEVSFSVAALGTAGEPLKGQQVQVRGRLTQTITTRKRMVGGFYAYDNRKEVKDLGTLCTGTADAKGLIVCKATLDAAGEVELIAEAKDAAGHAVQAATSVWITKQGELWFAQDNDDRIDVLPEKRRVEPGETARLQVRMPFREATALVTVEREGVIDTRIVTLRGDDPTVELKVDKAWGPNVYVSVLALRGRIRDVPWYSLFTWGWKAPLEWWRAYRFEGKDYQLPTAMVDLAKPAFKLGVAALEVGTAAHELKVEVVADQPQYQVRQKAGVRIKVTQGGQPLAGTEVAFAAVDEGLLALRDNASWQLLANMIQQRAWGVETSTAQSEIIGRRHYGRKAVAAGGGGGKGGTRELFDTLLLWQPRVLLDAKGEATLSVPLNDSLTSFRFVAVADGPPGAATPTFGTGSTTVRVSQDLQVLAGLPPLVRDGDSYTALVTLRNTTAREMKLRATLTGTASSGPGITRSPLALPPQDITLPAGGAKEITWAVAVPAGAFSIAWEAAAEEQGGAGGAARASDRVKLTQLVSPAVPLRVLQATLTQLDGTYSLPVAAPADALAEAGSGAVKRGGLAVAAQAKLSGALPGIRRYFETYPYSCLEQKTSKAIALRDATMWAGVAAALPTYLDGDGLASYFPPGVDAGRNGSDRLTAYVLAAAHEAGYELPAAPRDAMLAGLAAFVEGRLERKFWVPAALARNLDLDVRKLAAVDALARYGRAQGRMLGSVNVTPNLWPTAAVIDWLNILHRVKDVPDHAKRLDEAQQILRSRITYAGSTLKFSNEEGDFWWWLMDSADANAARLVLAVLDDPAWRDELPRLVAGSLGRQRQGAWLTTTANLWGALALDKFSAKFESTPVTGKTVAGTGSAGSRQQGIDWAKQPAGGGMTLPWPAGAGTLTVAQQGSGKPWLTVQSLAAVPLLAPLRAGYAVTRSVSAVEQKDPSKWSRGDVLRVRLEVDAQADMSWVVISDPVPGGATLLGSGLGRDSALATSKEKREGRAAPAFEERSFEAFRSYFAELPRGRHVVEYTVRLNNPGRFALPPTRVEAMYAPDSFGEAPNAVLDVAP